jgi:hypothetical protein
MLKINTDYSKKINMVAFPYEDIWSIKKRIEILEGIPAISIRLFKNNQILEDTQIVSNF